MDFTLLQTWLRLPGGSWPPDHYALLDLPPETADPGLIERHVMDRMDVLRRHQLRHPELVTAGMNQLAQALVCLSDAEERSAYNARLGLKPTATRETDVLKTIDDAEPLPPPDPNDAPLVQAVAARPPKSGRWVYRRLALIRRCLRTWDDLSPVLAVPQESLDRPAIAFTFLLAAEASRPLLPELRGVFEDRRAEVDLALQLLAEVDHIEAIRRLPQANRSDLAVQWRRGRTSLEDELHRLRATTHVDRPKTMAKRARNWSRAIRRNPELLLALLVAFAVLAALVRSSTGR